MQFSTVTSAVSLVMAAGLSSVMAQSDGGASSSLIQLPDPSVTKQIRFRSTASEYGATVDFITNATWADGDNLPTFVIDKVVYNYNNLGGRFVTGSGPFIGTTSLWIGFNQDTPGSVSGESTELVAPRWTYLASPDAKSFTVRNYRQGAGDIFDCGSLCTYDDIPGLESIDSDAAPTKVRREFKA
ncbi:hypothetical protein DHEL01_v204541 [Diaporthe helianthi]|uniref:DNase1 protein n=1 Tax=Diaporthe helianthi TaxID=158607 RepID=A0A2P5I3H9_DIAHE|nr:hypothetical protein DHEL01_v204541 [Diaporthe helianthi]